MTAKADSVDSRIIAAARAAETYQPDPDLAPVLLSLPFRGRWLAVNTPAKRVPSHGTHYFGQTYAIDFVAVSGRRRTSSVIDWRTLVATEPAARFYAYGQPILAPAAGEVVAVHNDEPDGPARRSLPVGMAYLLTQGSRLRQGLGAITGNSVTLALGKGGPYVLLAHLQPGSVRVEPGATVIRGEQLGLCGNSGNSTQPHLHLQVMDSADPLQARGLPLAFRDYRILQRGGSSRAKSARRPGHVPAFREVKEGVPGPREIVEVARRSKPVRRSRRK